MFAGDRAHLRLAKRLQGIGEHQDPQILAPGVARHGVGKCLELTRHDGDRRLAPRGSHDRVVNRPRGARASIPQADDGNVDLLHEGRQFPARELPFFAHAAAGLPGMQDGPGLSQTRCPDVFSFPSSKSDIG